MILGFDWISLPLIHFSSEKNEMPCIVKLSVMIYMVWYMVGKNGGKVSHKNIRSK